MKHTKVKHPWQGDTSVGCVGACGRACFRFLFHLLPVQFFQAAKHCKAVHSDWILNSETNKQNSKPFLCAFWGFQSQTCQLHILVPKTSAQGSHPPCSWKLIKHGEGPKDTKSLPSSVGVFQLHILKLLPGASPAAQWLSWCVLLWRPRDQPVGIDPYSASGNSLEERVLLIVFRAFPVSGSCPRRSGENPISQKPLKCY